MNPRLERLLPSAFLAVWFTIVYLLLALTVHSAPASQPQSEPEPERAPSPSARKVAVVLGDSLAAGYGVDPSEAFPAILQRKAEAAGLPFTVVNAGVSGDTTAGGLRRLDWILRRPVDVLVLELGGNDGLRGLPLEATRSNLVSMIQRAREKHPAVRLVLAGMQMPPNLGESYASEFRSIFPEVAREQKTALIPFLLEGVGGVPEMNLPDMIHPTPRGHEVIASNVWVVLEPVLRDVAGI